MNRRVASMDVEGTRRIFELASTMKNPINLSIGIPDFDVPDKVKRAAIAAINNGANTYTPTSGLKDLKQQIVKKLLLRNRIRVTEDQVLVTSAVSGALSIIFTTIINQDDEIILIDPYFVSYKQLVLQNGGRPIYAPSKSDFSLNLKAIKEKISSKTKAIVINSPNNPTGHVYSEMELRELVKLVRNKKILIISDEIYETFCYSKFFFSVGSIYTNTVTINGFSKSHSMTGWRVGYCCGPPEIIEQATKVQQYNFVCAPTPFQYAAIEALRTKTDKYLSAYKKRRDLVYDALRDNYSLIKPEGAFYAYIKYPFEPEKFMEACIKNNLLVTPGSLFSEKNDHFRISYSTKDKELVKGLKILNKIAEERKTSR